MAYRKNAEGKHQYYYKFKKTKSKIIQKEWLKEHKYKQEEFPPEFFENIEKKQTKSFHALKRGVIEPSVRLVT